VRIRQSIVKLAYAFGRIDDQQGSRRLQDAASHNDGELFRHKVVFPCADPRSDKCESVFRDARPFRRRIRVVPECDTISIRACEQIRQMDFPRWMSIIAPWFREFRRPDLPPGVFGPQQSVAFGGAASQDRSNRSSSPRVFAEAGNLRMPRR